MYVLYVFEMLSMLVASIVHAHVTCMLLLDINNAIVAVATGIRIDDAYYMYIRKYAISSMRYQVCDIGIRNTNLCFVPFP